MNLRYWFRHPWLLPARLRYWAWARMHPDKPWLCPGTIAYCEKHLPGTAAVLEFGSGRSTLWLARMVHKLTSVEHNEHWFSLVTEQLKTASVTVDYRLVSLDHPEVDPEASGYCPLPRYVQVALEFPEAALDAVCVDGHYRTTCIRTVVPRIKPGGLLIVDDVNMWPSRGAIPVPSEWLLVDHSTNGLKSCMIWQRPQ